MPLIIPNTTTQDAYSDDVTFAGGDIFAGGYFTVANNPVAVQLAVGQFGQAHWQDEQYLPPATYPIVPGGRLPISGLRFRSFIAGSPAQVFGGLVYPGEPSVQAGTPYTSVVSAGGAVTPVATTGQEIVYTEQAADVVVNGTEPAPNTVVDTGSLSYDGSAIIIEFFCRSVATGALAGAITLVSLWDAAVDLGRWGAVQSPAGAATITPFYLRRKLTPAAGTHRYMARAWAVGANGTMIAAGGLPIYMRVTAA